MKWKLQEIHKNTNELIIDYNKTNLITTSSRTISSNDFVLLNLGHSNYILIFTRT